MIAPDTRRKVADLVLVAKAMHLEEVEGVAPDKDFIEVVSETEMRNDCGCLSDRE
jgi:hypothetical protein